MTLRSVAGLLRSRRIRLGAAILCANLALSTSSIPCLCVCLAHGSPAPARASGSTCPHADDGDRHDEPCADHDHCAPNSACSQDQAPGVTAQPSVVLPSLELLALAPAAAVSNLVTPAGSTMLRVRAAPDRSPPIPPAFEVLRP
jgi:hypothetical protein